MLGLKRVHVQCAESYVRFLVGGGGGGGQDGYVLKVKRSGNVT
jgi:hypothetical protein